MEHFAGLDVSVKETSVCIVDDTSKIVREVKVASEPAALLAVFVGPRRNRGPRGRRRRQPLRRRCCRPARCIGPRELE